MKRKAKTAPTLRRRFSGKNLVKRNSRVNGSRPGIHAPRQVMNFGKAVLLEEHCDLLAASAVMADRNHLLVRIELAEARRDLPHRDVLRPFNARGLPFPGLAHVEEHGLLAALVREPGGKLSRRDLIHQKRNRGGCSAL